MNEREEIFDIRFNRNSERHKAYLDSGHPLHRAVVDRMAELISAQIKEAGDGETRIDKNERGGITQRWDI